LNGNKLNIGFIIIILFCNGFVFNIFIIILLHYYHLMAGNVKNGLRQFDTALCLRERSAAIQDRGYGFLRYARKD
jgi:hypothetical protein